MVNLLDKILPIAGIVIAVQTRDIIIWTGGQCNALHVIIILIMVICWVKITNGGIKLIPARNLVCTQRIREVSS